MGLWSSIGHFLYSSSSVRTSCMWFPGSLNQLSPRSQWNRLLWGPVKVVSPTAAWLAGVAALSSSTSYHSHLEEHMLFLRILATGFIRKFYARCLFQWQLNHKDQILLCTQDPWVNTAAQAVSSRDSIPRRVAWLGVQIWEALTNLLAFLLLFPHLHRSCILCSSAFFFSKASNKELASG